MGLIICFWKSRSIAEEQGVLLANFSCPPDLMQMSPVSLHAFLTCLSSDSHESITAPDASKIVRRGEDGS